MCANSDNMQDLGALREITSTIVKHSVRHELSSLALTIVRINDWASSALRMHHGERPTSQIMTISNFSRRHGDNRRTSMHQTSQEANLRESNVHSFFSFIITD